jgi:hypothetical protein
MTLDDKEKLKKVQFYMSQKMLDDIDRLRAGTGMTRTTFFINSFSLSKWWMEERRLGRRIFSLDEETNATREPVLPGFEP